MVCPGLAARGDGGGWAIASYGRNTARSQSEFVTEFAAAQNATVYCGNGAGRDIWGAQDRPWWEWIVVANSTTEEFASELVAELGSRGFELTLSAGDPSEYLLSGEWVETETANLEARGYATEWTTIRGATPQGLTIEGRIAGALTPRNNCFPKFGDVIIPVEPADFDMVAVLKFRDEAEARVADASGTCRYDAVSDTCGCTREYPICATPQPIGCDRREMSGAAFDGRVRGRVARTGIQ